jgi:hypothetical protein
MILDCFDVLMSKINLKNKKNIIMIHLKKKNILKNNNYHILKYYYDTYSSIF